MNGVEILASNEVVASTEANEEYFWLALGITIFVGSFLGLVSGLAVGEWFGGLAVGFACGIFLGLISGAFISFECGTDIYVTEYQVTISDEVSINEFMEHYDIIKQDGKIYTVRELE